MSEDITENESSSEEEKTVDQPIPHQEVVEASPAAMRWVAGCAIIGFLAMITLGVVVWQYINTAETVKDDRIELYKELGYKIITKKGNFDIDTPIIEKTVIKCPGTVGIIADCKNDIVIICATCNVTGNINATMTFYGNQLTIGADAKIKVLAGEGNLAVINGTIGENKAVFQNMMNKNSAE